MENPLESDDLTEVLVIDGMMEAEIIKSKLDNFQIPCMLKFEAVGRLLGITSDGLGRVQVMVPQDYLEKAREILDTETDEDQSEESLT